jgi:FAD/FMN-containing dehydrogenase
VSGAGRPAADLIEIFSEFSAHLSTTPLHDFSLVNSGTGSFCETFPKSAAEVSEIVRKAREYGVPLRIRGQGHSLNGSSLARPGEVVVQTCRLADVEFSGETTVTAGAGIVLWSLQRLLQTYNYALPVINDGYSGPSLGGYIAAGGFGLGSASYGGFWDNVAEITLVTGAGDVRRVPRDHELFPHLFGSMGQHGLIVRATLDLAVHETRRPTSYPQALRVSADRLPQPSESFTSQDPGLQTDEGLCWFTLFVSPARRDQALRDLAFLQAKHSQTFAYRHRYLYPVTHRAVAPPLIYPHPEPFEALGIWGIPAGSGSRLADLRAFEHDFMQMTIQRGYRRYIQSELPGDLDSYAQYFGAQLLSDFCDVKRQLDPDGLLNRETVFRGW